MQGYVTASEVSFTAGAKECRKKGAGWLKEVGHSSLERLGTLAVPNVRDPMLRGFRAIIQKHLQNKTKHKEALVAMRAYNANS